MTGMKTDGTQVDLWIRCAIGLRRTTAGWCITHEHESTPVPHGRFGPGRHRPEALTRLGRQPRGSKPAAERARAHVTARMAGEARCSHSRVIPDPNG